MFFYTITGFRAYVPEAQFKKFYVCAMLELNF